MRFSRNFWKKTPQNEFSTDFQYSTQKIQQNWIKFTYSKTHYSAGTEPGN